MGMKNGLFGGDYNDYHDAYIKPVLDQYQQQINHIQSSGVHGELARRQAMDDAMADHAQSGPAPGGGGQGATTISALGAAPSLSPDGQPFTNAGYAVGQGPATLVGTPQIKQLGPDRPGSAALVERQALMPSAAPLNAAPHGTSSEIGNAADGLLGSARKAYRSFTNAITSPEVTDVIKRQSEYLKRAGDTVALGGTGVAVAGIVTAQPELIVPGLAGMGFGEGLSTLGAAGVAVSDALANNRKAAIRDSIGGLVGSYLPYTIDPQQDVMNRTANYLGF